MSMRLIVLAKAPIPGRSKTRLSPPCSPLQGAVLAEAALVDTLSAVTAQHRARPVLVLEGTPGGWLPPGMAVVPQRGAGQDQRLAAAFEDVGGPALLIGMDTPQVTPALLEHCLEALAGPGVDAVLGPATDGGYWAIGLRAARPAAFLGVPMSRPDTGAVQRRRLDSLGLRVATIPALSDVDIWADALALEAHTRSFGAAVARVRAEMAAARSPARMPAPVGR